MNTNTLKSPGSISFIFYIIVRICLDKYWRQISYMWGYGFDILYVGLVGYYYKDRIISAGEKYLFHALTTITAFAGGYCIYYLAIAGGMNIRFNLRSAEVLFLLLIVAPILEEFIFRFALWEPLKDLIKDEAIVNFTCAILFSIAHFTAIGTTSASHISFLVFQTVYVVILGIACGWARMRTGSIYTSILIHLAFNLGFYISSKFIF
jgi:membrane protease YdiL (CAAX protease family)